jgi:hypothetical protein
MLTDLKNTLEIEKALLSTMCEDTIGKNLWNGTLEAKEQLDYISEELELIGLSFTDMMKIGNNHSLDTQKDMIKNIVSNFILTIEDVLVKSLEDKMSKDDLERFREQIVLDSYTHDSHYSLMLNGGTSMTSLNELDDVLNFYKIADTINEDNVEYSLNGVTVIDPDVKTRNEMLLTYVKTKANELKSEFYRKPDSIDEFLKDEELSQKNKIDENVNLGIK